MPTTRISILLEDALAAALFLLILYGSPLLLALERV